MLRTAIVCFVSTEKLMEALRKETKLDNVLIRCWKENLILSRFYQGKIEYLDKILIVLSGSYQDIQSCLDKNLDKIKFPFQHRARNSQDIRTCKIFACVKAISYFSTKCLSRSFKIINKI